MQLFVTILQGVRLISGMTSHEFNNLVGRLRPRLIHFASGFVRDGASTAEDMVQEAIVKLWKSSNEQKVRNPEALTIQILRNVCLDYIKLKKNNMESLKPTFQVYDKNDPAQVLESKDCFANILLYIDALPKDQMLAIRLRDIMGYEISEIAIILETSEGNVRTLLSRARQKIREKLMHNSSTIDL